MINESQRILITSSCRDCDDIPKVLDAGKILCDSQGNRYQCMHNGVKILYGTYHSPWMNTIIENLSGHHEPQEELVFHHIINTLNDQASMLELGCNWAYYSIWFNHKIKDPYNLCIEPDTSRLDSGKRNARYNSCTNIDFIQGGFGSIDSEKTYTLSRLFNESSVQYFDIVHSDTQGAEAAFLNLDQDTLDKVGYFVISTHHLAVHTQLINFFRSNNFHIVAEHNLSQSSSVDGLIVVLNNNNKHKYTNIVSIENCTITKR